MGILILEIIFFTTPRAIFFREKRYNEQDYMKKIYPKGVVVVVVVNVAAVATQI